MSTTIDTNMLETAWLPLDSIETNPVQPQIRHTDKAVLALRSQVEITNIITPVAVIRKNGHYIMVDGERRKAVARSLGRTHIQAVILPDTDPESAFARLNSGARKMDGREWFSAWGNADNHEGFEACLPPTQKRHIREMARIWGREEAAELAKAEKYAAGLVVSINITSAMFRDKGLPPRGKPPLTEREIGDWIIRHSARRFVVDFNKQAPSHKQVKALYLAIETDGPPPRAAIRY